jgi:hypothetical protein
MPGLSNLGMGYVFEELIRKFNEENNEEAGEHFTPREAIPIDDLPHVCRQEAAAKTSRARFLSAFKISTLEDVCRHSQSPPYGFHGLVGSECDSLCRSKHDVRIFSLRQMLTGNYDPLHNFAS